MKRMIFLVLLLVFIAAPIAAEKSTSDRAAHAFGCVINTGVAIWGWTCTRDNGQTYIKITAGFFTLRAINDFLKTIF